MTSEGIEYARILDSGFGASFAPPRNDDLEPEVEQPVARIGRSEIRDRTDPIATAQWNLRPDPDFAALN